MERLNIGSKPYNKSSKNTQNRLTHTKPRSQSFANSEQRTANSEQRTANSEQHKRIPRTYFIPKHNHRTHTNRTGNFSPCVFYCQVKMYLLSLNQVIPKGSADSENWSYGHNFIPVRSKFGWAAENILWKIQRSPRPPVICHSKSRIKTLGTKHPLRRTHAGFLRAQALKQGGKGGRDKLGSTDIVWSTVRYKFATGKLA